MIFYVHVHVIYDTCILYKYRVVLYSHFFTITLLTVEGNCTQGFLNTQLLEMLIKVLQNNQTSSSMFFSRDNGQFITPNTAFISSGILTKLTFAARFNHSNKRLPELQVWRKLAQNTFTKVHGISLLKPIRTGYFNVFELDLSLTLKHEAVRIHSGDVFGVYQPREDEARYSLAFLQSQDGPLTYSLPLLSNDSYSEVTLSMYTSTKMQPLITATVGTLDSNKYLYIYSHLSVYYITVFYVFYRGGPGFRT